MAGPTSASSSPLRRGLGAEGRLASDKESERSEHRVKVALRTRPLLPQEKIQKAKECVFPEASKSLVTFGRDRGFQFDHVFDQSSRQEDVFLECTSSLVDAVFEGYNACVFAYGQTSSGKTFTMGSCSHLIAEEDVGLIPRVINCIFERIEATRKSAEGEGSNTAGSSDRAAAVKFKVKCQFLEIHNEEVKDLLNPSTSKSSIAIRENSCGQIVVAGTKEEPVETREDLMRLLEMGSASRTTGDTRMNAHSSRSHAIFTIILDQDLSIAGGDEVEGGGGGGEALNVSGEKMTTRKVSAKFHMVDLAGSERQKKTGATGKRFKESVTINRGLLALGNVINALSSKQSQKHVPYRESKLTRMLQDSIGGNSRTIMIACVSTSDGNMEETLNTLKYASRARNIKNTTFVNYRKDPKEDELPDSDSTFVEVDQDAMADFGGSGGDKILALAEKLREAETKNLTLQGLLNDKIAVESCLQQLIHKFSSNGMVSDEAAKVFKEAFLAPLSVGTGDGGDTRKKLTSSRPPLFRPSSAVPQTRKSVVGYRPKSAASLTSSVAARNNMTSHPGEPNRERQGYSDSDKQEGTQEGGYHHAYPFAGESACEIDVQQGVNDFSAENEDEVLFDEEVLDVHQVAEGTGEEKAGSVNNEEEVELKLSKQKLEEELKQLSSHISHKEDLIEQLTKNQEEAEAASQAYETRAQELEVQVKEKEKEVECLKAEVSNLDESIAQSVEEKHELRLEYDEKLHHVVQQLSALKSKLKEGDATRLERVRQQSDKKISHLESDLDTMKVKQDSLRKKLKDTQRKYEQEVERIRKEADDSNRRVQQLEIENKRKTTLLKRKAEEAANAQRKLKELNQNSATDLQSSPIRKTPKGKSKSLAAVGKQVGVSGGQHSMKSSAVFDAQIEKMVQKNEVKEQLQSQKRRKIELMTERENLLQELSPYQKKKEKQREIINLKIREFMFAIEELDAEIDKMQGEATAGNEIAAKEVIELQNFRSDAYTRRCDLQNMLSTGQVLSDKEEEDVSELEDRLDGIVTELDYVIQQINESKVQLEEAEASGRKMKRLMANLSQKEIQSLLGMYLDNMVEMHSKERRDEKRLCELEIVNSRFKSQIDHLTSSLKAKDFEYDLRTTQLEKEHANKMQDVFSHMGLLSSINASSSTHDLEKENHVQLEHEKRNRREVEEEGARAHPHAQLAELEEEEEAKKKIGKLDGVRASSKEVYDLVKLQHEQISVLDKEKVQLRNANAELATKMKQLESEVAVNQNRYEQNILSMSMKFEETNSLNQNLMQEVSNYKKHLRSLGSAVRISRSSLRPLSAKDIQQKQLRASQSMEGFGNGLAS